MTKVSVIVPVYNVEQYLDKCLDSLVNQTLKDIEIIVVNDGSPDNSQQIIDRYKEKYPQIVSLIKENGGQADARNYGMKQARGEYISFVDGDDYVEIDFLEKMYNSTNNDKNIVVCSYLQEWPDKVEKIEELNYSSIYEYIAKGQVVPWNKLYKKSWLESINITFPMGLLYEDVEFFLKVMSNIANIEEISFVDKYLIHYIQRPGSTTYTQSKRINNIHEVSKNVSTYYQDLDNKYIQAMQYKLTKSLFGHFMFKYKKIPDKKLRKQLLEEHWEFINNQFPNYKQNPAINLYASLPIKIYLKLMCKPLYKLIGILPINL